MECIRQPCPPAWQPQTALLHVWNAISDPISPCNDDHIDGTCAGHPDEATSLCPPSPPKAVTVAYMTHTLSTPITTTTHQGGLSYRRPF